MYMYGSAPPRSSFTSRKASVLILQAIESAVRSVLSGELAKHAFSEVNKAVENAKRDIPCRFLGGMSLEECRTCPTLVGQSSTRMCWRSVGAVAAVSKRLSNGMSLLTGEAAVFLTAVVEHMAAELTWS